MDTFGSILFSIRNRSQIWIASTSTLLSIFHSIVFSSELTILFTAISSSSLIYRFYPQRRILDDLYSVAIKSSVNHFISSVIQSFGKMCQYFLSTVTEFRRPLMSVLVWFHSPSCVLNDVMNELYFSNSRNYDSNTWELKWRSAIIKVVIFLFF